MIQKTEINQTSINNTIVTLRSSFAESIYTTQFDNLSNEVIHQAKRCLLDFIGVSLAGCSLGISPIVNRLFGNIGGKKEASVIGNSAKLPIHIATFLNSVQGHSLDMDDGHRYSHGHPGVVTIPGAMAIAESESRSGRRLIEALVVGYQIFCNLGMIINPTHLSKGFHTTSTIGPFAAAASASKLLDLPIKQIEDALSLAGLQSAGLLEALVSGQMSKSFQVGKAAQSGIIAAYLAQDGAIGPTMIFEGQKGFFKAFCDRPYELIEFKKAENDQFEIMKIYFKGHAACRHIHPILDAANEILKLQDVDISKIDIINVDTYSLATQFTGQHTGRDSAVAANFSIPVSIGLMLVFGSASPDIYTDTNINNDLVQSIADKVVIHANAERDKVYPSQRSASITIKAGQQEFSNEVLYAKGEPENSFSDKELFDKFILNATKVLKADHADKLAELILNMENIEISDIFKLTTP